MADNFAVPSQMTFVVGTGMDAVSYTFTKIHVNQKVPKVQVRNFTTAGNPKIISSGIFDEKWEVEGPYNATNYTALAAGSIVDDVVLTYTSGVTESVSLYIEEWDLDSDLENPEKPQKIKFTCWVTGTVTVGPQ